MDSSGFDRQSANIDGRLRMPLYRNVQIADISSKSNEQQIGGGSSELLADDVCTGYIARQQCYAARRERDDIVIGDCLKQKTMETSTKIEVGSIDTVQCVGSATNMSYGMLQLIELLNYNFLYANLLFGS